MAERHRPLPLRQRWLSGVAGDGDSGRVSVEEEVGRGQWSEWSSLEESVETGVEWNGEEVELGWRRVAGEMRGQRASRPWLDARGADWEVEEWGEERREAGEAFI